MGVSMVLRGRVTSTFAFAITFFVVSPLAKDCRVVGDGGLVVVTHKCRDLELGVTRETLVSVEFHEFVKRESASDIGIGTCGVDGVIRLFCYGVQKPVNFLFFGGRVFGVIV